MGWMPNMRIRYVAALAPLAIIIGCAHNYRDPRREAYQKGQQAAVQEIAQDDPHLYGIAFAGGPPVDARTGLPMTWFSNCVNDRAMEAFVRGHNDYVLRHLSRATIAPNPTARRG